MTVVAVVPTITGRFDIPSLLAAQIQSPRIVRLHAALDDIVLPGTRIEKVPAEVRRLAEGPLWTRDGALLFSDIAANVISRLSQGRTRCISRARATTVNHRTAGPWSGPTASPSTAKGA